MSSQMQNRITALYGEHPVTTDENPFIGDANLCLRLDPMLLVTLDVEHLFDKFYFDSQRILSFDGISFDNNNYDCHYSIGLQSLHQVHYRLFSNQDYVGEICIFRNTVFSENDMVLLENLTSMIIAPLRKTLCYQEAIEPCRA